jgi:hypothetical protein
LEFIARFYESESSMALERKYIRYRKESISKFQMEMKKRMMQALHVPLWMDETMKSRYQKFMDNMVHDALWNAKNVFVKYGKKY